MRGIQEVAASSTGHVTTCKATIHTEYTVLYIVFEFYSVYKSTLKRRIHLNNCTMSSIQSYTGAIVKRIMFSSIIRRKCFIKPLEILILGVWSCQNPTALLSFSHDWAFSWQWLWECVEGCHRLPKRSETRPDREILPQCLDGGAVEAMEEGVPGGWKLNGEVGCGVWDFLWVIFVMIIVGVVRGDCEVLISARPTIIFGPDQCFFPLFNHQFNNSMRLVNISKYLSVTGRFSFRVRQSQSPFQCFVPLTCPKVK